MVRRSSDYREATLLAWTTEEEGPQPRHVGSLWEAGKARRWSLPENRREGRQLSDTVI